MFPTYSYSTFRIPRYLAGLDSPRYRILAMLIGSSIRGSCSYVGIPEKYEVVEWCGVAIGKGLTSDSQVQSTAVPLLRSDHGQVDHTHTSQYKLNYTVSQKTSHLWLAITLTHMDGFWYLFGKNVTDEVGNQKTLYYATSSSLCFCTTWQNAETRKSHFTQLDCVTHTMHLCAVFLKEKNCRLWCIW